jgi:hypothetical protein
VRASRAFGLVVGLAVIGPGCAHMKRLPPGEALNAQERKDAIRRASVWSPTNIPATNFKEGPKGEGSFARNEWVSCEYKEKKTTGASPKFVCETSPGHEIKVKYGLRNAEVFGEVLATRLFWGLGFAADRMYPVRVRCKGCPKDPAEDAAKTEGTSEFDPAAVEWKLPGRAMETSEDSGWNWAVLDDIGPEAPKDEAVHRDALKLLAAFVQHSDSKSANQRLLCPEGKEIGKTGCSAPILMVQDLGLTFGEASLLNMNKNSVSFAQWSEVSVWKDQAKCVAELKGSFSGKLKNPTIGEPARAFLAGLLGQLSDAQLRDLFATARVQLRSTDPSSDPDKEPADATVAQWVKAFKNKRAQIVDHRCPR